MDGAPTIEPAEAVIATSPFTIRRQVRWADCDPAGVVHTGRFSDYVLSTADLFRRHLIGPGWQEATQRAGFGLPAKALSLVFQSSLWPHDAVDIAVYVGGIRPRTIDLLMRAVRADNRKPVFAARLTSICVTAGDRRIAMPWPGACRAAFANYHEQQAVPAELDIPGLRAPTTKEREDHAI